MRVFTSVCYGAARVVDGSVTSVRTGSVTSSFYTAEIVRWGHRTAVLRHIVQPLVAFARPLSPGGLPETFLDDDRLAAAVRSVSDLDVLTVEQLTTPLSEADLTALDDVDRHDLAYWQPYTVGELLFNFWD